MPILPSFLKVSGRTSLQINGHDKGDLRVEHVNGKGKKRLKRDILGGLFRRSAKSARGPAGPSAQNLPAGPSKGSVKPVAVLQSSTSNANKLLPSALAALSTGEPALEPSVEPKTASKSNKASLPQSDIHKLFSGAPQFQSRSESTNGGGPHPSVTFPWNSDADVRDLSDHVEIEDESWSCVTAWSHPSPDALQDSKRAREHAEKNKVYFVPGCREKPNMLSMNGLERGTIGFQAALEVAVADSFMQAGEDTAEGLKLRSESRQKLLTGKEGLRPVSDSILIERLKFLSTSYQENAEELARPAVEMYTELFTQVLFPPSRVIDAEDPYSLHVQAEALIIVLARPMVWIDFSLVEWRIRLGNLLWGPSIDDMTEDEVVAAGENGHDPSTEKYWLLLQTLLSCELLIRLDYMSATPNTSTVQAISQFNSEAAPSVKWSLLLARQWLENIRLEKASVALEKVENHKQTPRWLGGLSQTTTTKPSTNQGIDSIKFLGRHQARQVLGLIHFAHELKWPNLDSLTAKVSANSIFASDSIHDTSVIGTPMSMSTQRSSSYFSSKLPRIRRGLSTQQSMSAFIQPSGWLSNSYISGLVLPGEGLAHFLISTLLENDEAAIASLGEDANLYCGFLYEGRSFWSTSCVIGRVLAAGAGATECMGWIASQHCPNSAVGWVDIEVKHDESKNWREDPRIWKQKDLELEGDILGGADTETIYAEDFVLPLDEISSKETSITFESLDLLPADAGRSNIPREYMEIPRSPMIGDEESFGNQAQYAQMRFALRIGGEEKKVDLSIQYDVLFVTSHPCLPSRRIELRTLSPGSAQTVNGVGFSGSQELHTGHPLHNNFKYVTTSLYNLIYTTTRLSISELLDPAGSHSAPLADSNSKREQSRIRSVLVIDCAETSGRSDMRPKLKQHIGSDLEMLARAYCAERGWNALISRRGRTCLACSIRETSALGWRVLLRM